MTPVSSNVKPNTRRRPPTSATLPKAKKKRIIVDEDNDIDNYDIEEEEPSWLDSDDDDTFPVKGETSKGGQLSLELIKTKWMVRQLNKVQVFSVLQGKNQGTPRKTPKSEVYRTLAKAYNKRFPPTKKPFDQKSMKNKIESMKAAFKRGHGLAHKSGFGSEGSESWTMKIKEACSYYFDLEANWAVAWSDDVPEYCDSTKNMGDPVIDGIVSRQAAIDLTLDTNAVEDVAAEHTWTTEGSGEDGEESQWQREERWREEEGDEEAQEDGRPVPILRRPSHRSLNTKRNRSRSDSTHHESVVQQIPATTAEGRTSTTKAQNKGKGKTLSNGSGGSNKGNPDKMQALVKTVRSSLEDDKATKWEELEIKKEKLELEIKKEKLELEKKEAEERRWERQARMALEERRLEIEAAERRQKLANDHAYRMAQLAMQKEVEFRKIEVEAEMKRKEEVRLRPSRNLTPPTYSTNEGPPDIAAIDSKDPTRAE